MPIYEYQCELCAHKFEKLQKISDEPLKVCPECKKESLIKVVSAAGFRLSGSGWYETDFKSDSQIKRNLVADKKSAVESATKNSKTSDAKKGDVV